MTLTKPPGSVTSVVSGEAAADGMASRPVSL